MSSFTHFALAGLLAMTAHQAVAQGGQALDGQTTLLGYMNDQGRHVVVRLQLAANPEPGDLSGKIYLGEPWACGFDLEYGLTVNNKIIYSLAGSGAGRCQAWRGGYVEVESKPAGTTQVVAHDRFGSLKQTMDLSIRETARP